MKINSQKLIGMVSEKLRNAVEAAIEFANQKHLNQIRPGGEAQIEHLLRVALRAAEYMKNHIEDEDSEKLVIASLLHDVIEDTFVTAEEIKNLFGEEVAQAVQAVSHKYEEEPDEEYLRQVALGGKLAILVKRFDRLDNLESLKNAPVKFREQKIREIKKALPIWEEIDSKGAEQIKNMLRSFES